MGIILLLLIIFAASNSTSSPFGFVIIQFLIRTDELVLVLFFLQIVDKKPLLRPTWLTSSSTAHQNSSTNDVKMSSSVSV